MDEQNTSPRLSEVSDRFRAESSEIEQAFLASEDCHHVTQYTVPYAPHVDGCVVSLWDAWNRFLREVVLLSCSDTTIGSRGGLYTPTMKRNEEEVLNYLSVNAGRLGVRVVEREPNWYNVTQLAAITLELGLANSSQIIGAVGVSSIELGNAGTIVNPIEDIRTVRNFIAHKTKTNLIKVRRLAQLSASEHVHSYLWSKTVGGVGRFSEWVTAMCVVADAVCF